MMTRALCIVLSVAFCLSTTIAVQANPVPSPVIVSEFSTDEDWIEIYFYKQSINDYYMIINGYWVDINVPITPDDQDESLYDRSYIVLDETNTSGFNLTDGYGSIEFRYSPEFRYGTWGDVPAPPKDESVSSYAEVESGIYYAGYSMTKNPTPGAENTSPRPTYGSSDVVINEFYPFDTDPAEAFIELFNAGETAIDIGGWSLIANTRYIIPENTIIEPGQFWFQLDFPDEFLMSSDAGTLCLQTDEEVLVEKVGWSGRNHSENSFVRFPDGFATDFQSYDNESAVDFRESIPTPGMPNQQKYEIESIQIESDSVIVNPGEQYQYFCTGVDENGYTIKMMPNWSIDSMFASIDQYGILTGISYGKGMVIASWDDVSDSTYVIVTLAGTIQDDYIMTAESSPYIIGELYIQENKMLTIEPGITIIMHERDGLNVYGTIQAIGDSLNPIVFTSKKEVGKVQVYSTSNSFKYCFFENLDYAIRFEPMVPVSETNSISCCIFLNNNYGVQVGGGNARISQCLFINNRTYRSGIGIAILEHLNNVLINNNVVDNCDIGFFITNSQPMIFNNNITGCNTGFLNGSYKSWNYETVIQYNNTWSTVYPFYNISENYGITTTNSNGTPCDQYYNISVDPLFADPENGDFRLLEGSPCIDAGDPSILDGDGSPSDIGAYSGSTVISGIDEEEVPTVFDLQAAYPNPFNPRTTLSFTLPEASPVRLAVYSVSGQKVATLVDEYLAAGSHSAIFDGSGLASGVYFYRCEAVGAVKSGRMVLVK